MMKKIFLFMLVSLFISVTTSAYNAQINGIYYDLYENSGSEKQAVVTSGGDKYTGAVVIPDHVVYNGVRYEVRVIGNNAFFQCTNLTSITIPNGIVSIGKDAFSGCSGLTSLYIPETILSIGEKAFFNCHSLTSITVDSNNDFWESPNHCNALIDKFDYTLVLGCKNTVIPDDVTAIGDFAFYNTELSSVTIPNSVTSIGVDAFGLCKYITSLTIPASVTSIGESAFASCYSIASITVENGNPVYDSRNDCNAIIRTSDNELITGCKNTVIPYGVTSIGERAFSGCRDLTTITIPQSVTSIGNYAFLSCESLTSIYISNSVFSIGNDAFTNVGLTSLIIPNSVTSIGKNAFNYCSHLTSVTIPNSVSSIGKAAFDECRYLTNVKVGWTTPLSINQELFGYGFNYTGATLYVPSGTRDAYMAAPYWKFFGTIQEYPKCATPTISVIDGKLHFKCETPGAQFSYGYTFDGAGQNTGNDVPLSSSYNVWVVAKKSGYDDSDRVTMNIDACGLQGDVNRDGKVSISDAVGVVNIILDNGGSSAPALSEPEEAGHGGRCVLSKERDGTLVAPAIETPDADKSAELE